jgi:iron(III) transport system substrate-binding protein
MRWLGLFVALMLLLLAGCGGGQSSGTGTNKPPAAEQVVVCYTSTDQVFAEPILKEFERQTGIKVKAKYDTEETKTTGIVNLIMQEKNRPQADVFWSSETGRAVALKSAGCLAPYKSANSEAIPGKFKDPENYWTGFSARARVIIYNTDLIKGAPPSSIHDLLKPEWSGKAGMANPLFGTTSFHATAIFLAFGDDKAKAFFSDATNNGLQILPSNGAIKEAVASGRLAWGLTDTDDANVAIKDGRPVKMIYPDQDGIGTPVMPNTVSLIAGAPHPDTAKKLIDFLLSPGIEKRLAEMDCVQMPLHPNVPVPDNVKPVSAIKPMDVDYIRVAERIKDVDKILRDLMGL